MADKKGYQMKIGSTIFLRGVVIIIGIVALAICILVLPPAIISDNAGYYRPILLGMYVPAIPFFIALYQAMRLLNYIDKNQAFSTESVRSLRSIKSSAAAICALYIIGMPYIFYVADRDDAPGVAAIGFVIIGASFVIATAAAVFQQLFHKAVNIKSENDLIV